MRKIPGNTLPCRREKAKKIMIIAGEPSGDLHGANVIHALKKRQPGICISGIGGDAMARAGMDLRFHIRDLSVMGVTEVLMKLRCIAGVFRGMERHLEQWVPDLLILIDYPGFNLKMAAVAKGMEIPVLYYISPKVWAWKLSRLKKIKKNVDHVALIFPFEVPLYQRWKIPHTFVGHPLLDCREYAVTHVPGTRTAELVIGLLPGSRNAEIATLLDPLLKASRRIARLKPQVRFLLSRADAVDKERFNLILARHSNHLHCRVIPGDVTKILTAADLIIAASGTVTLEAALFGVPTIIIYKMSRISYALARLFVHLRHVGLANIIAGEEIMPELLQSHATPEKISDTTLHLLEEGRLFAVHKRLQMIPGLLGGKGASRRVAALALGLSKFTVKSD